jgi:hypothetical protein
MPFDGVCRPPHHAHIERRGTGNLCCQIGETSRDILVVTDTDFKRPGIGNPKPVLMTVNAHPQVPRFRIERDKFAIQSYASYLIEVDLAQGQNRCLEGCHIS